MRELAWIEVDLEPPEKENLMDDEQFDEEARMAAEGRWEELGLDPLPDGYAPATIEDLRNDSA